MSQDVRETLEEAWETICQRDRSFRRWACQTVDGRGTTNAGRFARLLDAEAWTDAALCLVPEGFDWSMDNFDGELGKPSAWICNKGPFFNGAAGHPALALAQACLKARENGDG